MPAGGKAPTCEELTLVLERNHGSIRATARYYGRDRKQIYRWLDAFDMRERATGR